MQPDRMQPTVQSRATSYDVGLRAHMQQIYNRMIAGVLVTALVAYGVSASPDLMRFFLSGPQMYVVMFAPLAVLWFGFRPTMPASKLALSFFAIAVLYGISFSAIAYAFTGESIARAFFITVAMFAGLSVFGYTSKKNLDGLGSFTIMGIWGVFILSIINLFVGSSLMQNVICGVSIIAFAGLTAWQTQAMKQMYNAGYGTETNSRTAWFSALNLYIAFIALFQNILRFTSNR